MYVGKNKFIKLLVRSSFAFVLFFVVCSCKNEKAPVIDSSQLAIVKTVKPEKKRFADDLNSLGTISYKTKNNVTALVEGTIYKLNVKEGDFVTKGQVIALLRNVQLEIQKEQATNSLETARVGLFQAETALQEEELNIESRLLNIEKNEYNLHQLRLELDDACNNLNKNKELLEVGGITESSYIGMEISVKSKQTDVIVKEKEIEISKLGLRDEDLIRNGYEITDDLDKKTKQLIELNTRSARASVESARAQLSSAQKNLDSADKLLDELTIRAPVTGIVGVIYFENGEYVPQNEKILTLMDISEVNAVFSIHEQEIQYFNVGDILTIELPSIDKSYKSKISEISPIADSSTGNFTVKAIIPNSKNYIKPGMFVKCTVLRNEKNEYLCFPETCLVQKDGNKGSVFSVVNGFAVQKEVTIKNQKNGYVWIENGLKQNDVLIDKPSPFLKEGTKVETH